LLRLSRSRTRPASSVVPQCDERRDAAGSACRDEAREEGTRGEDQGDGDPGRRIEGRDLEQQSGNEAADIPEWLATHPLPPSAYAVIVTRGHRHDLDALRTLAGQRLRYLGLIGSRAKVRRVFDALVAEGAATDALAAVHAPIGLDIGAVTPQEIAVAILAELIAVRRGRTSDAGTVGASLRWAGALTDG
jgi:xanthine/CO dehydrogenase XdhC/CoxF family maturation factor